MYRPADRWVWDFWTVNDGDQWHLFHLQADRSLPADERHWHASIGHAVSADLTNWTDRGTVLTPGAPGTWDGDALWTGSVLAHHNGRWIMAYTGIERRGDVAIERIGLAWSDDLDRWTKDPANPVLESDPRWYEPPGATTWQHGWRDPFLFRHRDGYGALISARTNGDGSPYRRGAIAFASSPDGESWEVHQPIPSTMGHFAQLEVPHVVGIGARCALVFSTNTDGPWPRGGAGPTLVGTGVFIGDSPTGPFAAPQLFDATPRGGHYAGRLVADGDVLRYLAFADAPAERFRGGVLDPIDMTIDPSGRPVPASSSVIARADPGATGRC